VIRFAVILVLLLSAPLPARCEHALGARQQWQPQVGDTDARLQQAVEIEIVGRAAGPALALLSEKTGVSLSVAPENLDTVGERKLTIIAEGCSLKAIMTQIPEALQECHWDLDASGEEPVYLLHRNAGVENTTAWLADREAARRAEEKRASRLARMEDARRALGMSPEELTELEKTDLLMARSVQDPHSRDMLEALLSLPPEQADQFRDTGGLELEYAKAPERLQQVAKQIAEWFVYRMAGESLSEEVRNWQDHLSHATISFADHGVDHGWGVWLSLNLPGQGYPRIHDVALQPRYCNLDEGGICYTRLLIATGAAANEEAAFEMVKQRDLEGFRVDAAKREERHAREWVEPTDPDLLQTIVIGEEQFSEFAQIQHFIAQKTGLSIISDYFTLRAPYLPEDIRKGVPVWRLLYLLGEHQFRGDVYLWEKLGNCLVFHRADWYGLVKAEAPESLILSYREKLRDQGFFTVEDLAELAVVLKSRGLSASNFPRDLQRAGIHVGFRADWWALLLYASLSPDQLEKVRTAEGLPFANMTIAQRQQVIDKALGPPKPLAKEQAYQASFHLVESTEEVRGRRFATTMLELRFPDHTDAALVQFRLVDAKPQAAGN